MFFAPKSTVRAAALLFAALSVSWSGAVSFANAQTGPSRLVELSTGDATRGWEAVGRLNLGHGGFCTGALIANDMVLTAAHCLYHKDTGALLPLSDMEFLAGFRNGRAEAYRGVRRAVAHPDYVYDEEEQVHRVAVDLALIQLDRPIRSNRIRPFETRSGLERGDQVGVVSYAKDRSEAPSLQEVCHILERASGVVMLSCSVDFGASGAPIFAQGPNGPVIVSVVSAKAEASGQKVSLGSELSRILPTLQATFEASAGGILNSGGARATTVASTSRNGAKFLKP